MNHRGKYRNAEGLDEYRPSYFERSRLSQFKVEQTEEGTQITDDSPNKWEPTERQQAFLHHLLDDEDCELSLYHAMRTVDGTMGELKRWCRREPQFLGLLKKRSQEHLEQSELQAAVKLRVFIRKMELRLVEISRRLNPEVTEPEEREPENAGS